LYRFIKDADSILKRATMFSVW